MIICIIPCIPLSPLRQQHLTLRPRAFVFVICHPYTPAMRCQYCWISPQWSVKPKNLSSLILSDNANKSVERCNIQLKRWKLNGHASTQIYTCSFYFIRKRAFKEITYAIFSAIACFSETHNQVTLYLYFNEIISCFAILIQVI